MTSPGARAEALVAELGIEHAQDLDVEAIAFDSHVEVIYETMKGCEASLVGYLDRAIATINPCGVRGRERFSVAHELGHWHLHRGRSFQCRVDDPGVNLSSDRSLEKDADSFAAHLLLPSSLFKPVIGQFSEPAFKQINEVAAQFQTSLTATTLRLVNLNIAPVILACYGKNGKRWSMHATDIPRRWFLKKTLDADTFAHDLLYRGVECRGLGKQPADAWFDNDDAGDYEVREECVANLGDTALVLLYLETDMMTARFDPNRGSRR